MPGEISVELLGGGEPAPLLALRIVLDDVGFVRPLRGAVANLLPPRRSPDRTERFCGREVDLRGGEVGDPPAWSRSRCVMMMCRTSSRAKPSRSIWWATVSSWLRIALTMRRVGPTRFGIVAVMCAVATVDQDQPVVGFDQQHVADHRGGRHVHGAAVEVVDLHASPGPPDARSSNCSISSLRRNEIDLVVEHALQCDAAQHRDDHRRQTMRVDRRPSRHRALTASWIRFSISSRNSRSAEIICGLTSSDGPATASAHSTSRARFTG